MNPDGVCFFCFFVFYFCYCYGTFHEEYKTQNETQKLMQLQHEHEHATATAGRAYAQQWHMVFFAMVLQVVWQLDVELQQQLTYMRESACCIMEGD